MSSNTNKHLLFLEIAQVVSKFSKANRKKVGSVIVDTEGRIVATGYNGTPKGASNVCEEDGVTLDTVIHSEVNAILNSTINDLRGSTLYTTYSPCLKCASMIVQKGIGTVIYSELSIYPEGVRYLVDSGITVMIVREVNGKVEYGIHV